MTTNTGSFTIDAALVKTSVADGREVAVEQQHPSTQFFARVPGEPLAQRIFQGGEKMGDSIGALPSAGWSLTTRPSAR